MQKHSSEHAPAGEHEDEEEEEEEEEDENIVSACCPMRLTSFCPAGEVKNKAQRNRKLDKSGENGRRYV